MTVNLYQKEKNKRNSIFNKLNFNKRISKPFSFEPPMEVSTEVKEYVGSVVGWALRTYKWFFVIFELEKEFLIENCSFVFKCFYIKVFVKSLIKYIRWNVGHFMESVVFECLNLNFNCR